jgi:Flp pilus assembly secretin CpaC
MNGHRFGFRSAGSNVRRCCAAATFGLLLLPSIASAQEKAITIGLGTSSGLLLDRPFKTILIGDPNIVDVLERGNRAVILQSLNLGATNVIFLDESSIVIANVRIVVCKTAANPIAYDDDPGCGHVNATTPST